MGVKPTYALAYSGLLVSPALPDVPGAHCAHLSACDVMHQSLRRSLWYSHRTDIEDSHWSTTIRKKHAKNSYHIWYEMVYKRYEIILISMCGMMTYHFFSFYTTLNEDHTRCISFHTTWENSYPPVFISYHNVGNSYPGMNLYDFDFHAGFIP